MFMKNRVIYIIGSGRSGTTLLDIILGNAGEIFSAGELNRFTEKNGIPTDTNNKEANVFWEKICSDLTAHGLESPVHYAAISKKYEHHSGFLRLLFNSTGKNFNVYADYQKKFFETLFNNVAVQFNRHIIIDSSKYAVRGYFLSKVLGGNIAYINIKRNPLAVVESFRKKDVEQDSKSRLMANLYLLAVNGLALIVFKKLRKKNALATIYYEDLLKDPVSTLQTIENNLGISLQKAKEIISDNSALKVGYLFDGNRLRVEKEIRLKRNNVSYAPTTLTDKFFYAIHKLVWYKK